MVDNVLESESISSIDANDAKLQINDIAARGTLMCLHHL